MSFVKLSEHKYNIDINTIEQYSLAVTNNTFAINEVY